MTTVGKCLDGYGCLHLVVQRCSVLTRMLLPYSQQLRQHQNTGYGNQAPSTVGGTAMIYTLGFLSIILFASVLSTSGTIVSHLVGDFVSRTQMKCFLKRQFMLLFWGCLCFGWMAFLAYHFYMWNRIRLEEEVRFSDAYWFAFISTTTVGLGDFYPAPEVIFVTDLLAFSLSFLFGFVLLSTFLSELAQLFGQYFPDLSEELSYRLKYVGFCRSGKKGWRKSQRALEILRESTANNDEDNYSTKIQAPGSDDNTPNKIEEAAKWNRVIGARRVVQGGST